MVVPSAREMERMADHAETLGLCNSFADLKEQIIRNGSEMHDMSPLTPVITPHVEVKSRFDTYACTDPELLGRSSWNIGFGV